MIIKPGVEINKLHPMLSDKLKDIESCFMNNDSYLVITAGHEGHPGDNVHMPTSHHYLENFGGQGGAIDCRMRHLNYITMVNIEAELQHRLGSKFDVVLEIKDKMGEARNHCHIELHELPA